MIKLIESFDPLLGEENRILSSSEWSGRPVIDLIPANVQKSDVTIQVVHNFKDLETKELYTSYLMDGDEVIIRSIPRAPVLAVFTLSNIIQTVALTGIGFGLQYLIGILLGKPKTPRLDRRDSPRYGFDTPQMTTQNGAVIQVVYGKIKTSGQLIQIRRDVTNAPEKKAKLIRSSISMLVSLGDGGEEGFESIAGITGDIDDASIATFGDQLFINDNAANTFEDLVVSVRMGKKHQSSVKLIGVDKHPFEETSLVTASFNFTLFQIVDSNIATLSRAEFIYNGQFENDRMVVDISFDNLARTDDFDISPQQIDIAVDWRDSGTIDWLNTIDIRRKFTRINSPRIERVEIPGKFDEIRKKRDIRVRVLPKYTPRSKDATIRYMITYLYNNFGTRKAFEEGNREKIIVRFVDSKGFNILKNVVAEMGASVADLDPSDLNTSIRNVINKNPSDLQVEKAFFVFKSGAGVDIQIAIRVVAVEELIDESFTYPGKALLAVNVVASEQLQGGQPSVSAIVEGIKVRKYTNPSTYTIEFSQNPAWIILDFITSERYGLGNLIKHSDVDIQSFIDTAAFCDVLVSDGAGGTHPRCELNIVIDQIRDGWEWVYLMLRSAHLLMYRTGGFYRIKPEEVSNPIMLFNPANSFNFKPGYTAPANRINYIDGTFLDESDAYREAVAVALDELVTETSLYVKETTDLIGITRRAQAHRIMNQRINTHKLLTRYATWEADVPAIRCEPGDVVQYASENVFWGEGSGLVVSSTTTTIKLDKYVTISSGVTYKIRVFHKDESFEEFTVSNIAGEYNELFISGTWITNPVKNEPYSFGRTTNLLRSFRVVDIQRTSEFRAKIFGLQYDAAVYSDTIIDISGLVPQIGFSPLDIPPDVSNVVLNERFVRFNDGTVSHTIDVFFDPPINFPAYAYSDIWLGSTEDFTDFGDVIWSDKATVSFVKSGSASINGPFHIGGTYYVAVTSSSIFGKQKRPEDTQFQRIDIVGKAVNPPDVVNFRVVRFENLLSFGWDEIEELDLLGYEIRTGDTWEGGILIGTNILTDRFQTNNFFADLTGAVNQKFMIKAKDTLGNYSTTETAIVVSVDPRFGVDIYVARNEKTLSWPGTKVDVTVSGGSIVLDTGFDIGTYETPEIDLTVLARSRVSVFLESAEVNTSLTWDLATFTWDSIEAQNKTWDGTVGNDNFFVTVEAKYDSVTPITTSYKRFINEEVQFRYARFKLTLETKDPQISGQVSEFRMCMDAIEIFDAKKNISINMATSNPSTISYNTNVIFHNDSAGNPSTALNVTAQNLGSGEYFVIQAKTLTGFTIEFFNAGGPLTTGTIIIDYVVTGF